MLVQRGFHDATGGTLTEINLPVNFSTGDIWATRGAIAKPFFIWQFDRMKSFLAAGCLLMGLACNLHAQQEADDKYISVYGLIQQADSLLDAGSPGEALAAYGDAQIHLQLFQRQFPTWNPNIVGFRLNHIAEKIAELKSKGTTTPAPEKSSVKPESPNPPAATNETNLLLPSELDNARTQLQIAQAANDLLQAKLKEALAVQPAAIDPRELAEAREKIRDLMKENDLLKASHASVTPAEGKTLIVTNFTTVYITNNPGVVTNFVDVFAKNPGPAVVTNFIRTVVIDTNALELLQHHLDNAVKNFNDEHDRAEQLANEVERLKKSSRPAAGNDDAASATLLAENARLKSQLIALQTISAKNTPDEKSAGADAAALQSQLETARLEKLALQRKLQQVLTGTNSATIADYEARIQELTAERNQLMEKLDLANRQKSNGKLPDAVAQISSLTEEVAILRSRLAVTEAPPIPYSAEELALFKTAIPPAANPDAGKKSINELPAGTAELVASAQQHFVHQEFTDAEADYLKILDRDQNNGIALANLATIELQENKLAEAEKHITAAIAQNPEDAYNLSTLGYLKFRKEKYDDALNVLSHAAQVDPNNPEIQNYLGVTLSHKGQRKDAETALRRAIQLNPNYAPAHNNLAVIYLSQTPPMAELARWHYQKALDAGQPRNADLEKMLADKGAPVAP
jgi:tetratricopeptide (TPR) repeat protein